jgi:hypothetical protein
VILHQPRHQRDQRRLRLRRQPGPRRHPARPRSSCEQVDLLRRAATPAQWLRLAWHGPLPDSGRERESMRSKAGHSMIPDDRSTPVAKALQAR